MLRALVTGAGGFIGRQVVSELRRRNIEVRTLGLRQDDARADPLFRLDDRPFAARSLAGLIEEATPAAIFHLAGASQGLRLFDVNVGYATRLIEAVRRLGLRTPILLAGSAAEYGEIDEADLPVSEEHPCRPFTPYGISKHAQTLVALAAAAEGLPVVVARLFNVVGAGMPAHLPLMEIAARLAASKATGVLPVGNLDLERDFVDVADAARSLVGLAFHRDARGAVVNLCSGRGFWLRALVERMAGELPWPVTLTPASTPLQPRAARRVVGRPDRLVRFGFPIPPPDFDVLVPLLVAEGRKAMEQASEIARNGKFWSQS